MQADASQTAEAGRAVGQSGHFTRSYVACDRCRLRKVKCIVGQRPPCAKCEREHRTCVFTQHRTSRKQRKPPDWTATPRQQEDDRVSSSETPMNPIDGDLGILEDSTFVNPPGVDHVRNARTQQSLVERAVPSVMFNSGASPILNNIALTTAPSQLASRHNELLSGGFGQLPAAPVAVNQLCEASDQLLATWNKCRFVRQGWLTAQAAITYVEL